MLQKVTFVGHMITDIPEMSVAGAKRNVRQALADGDQEKDYALRLVRVISVTNLEES